MITINGVLFTFLLIWFFAYMMARTLFLIGINTSSAKKDALITFAQAFVITIIVESWVIINLKS